MDPAVRLAQPRPSAARAEFEAFFERHHHELSRLAYLLTGDHPAADDLTADVLLAAWRQWARVWSTDDPLAYVRRVMVNQAATRVRKLHRERVRMRLLLPTDADRAGVPDGAAVVDVRAALQRLPARRRACVVLRYAFDLSEQDVARLLGVSIGTVKSQTAKAVAQLSRLLGPSAEGWVGR